MQDIRYALRTIRKQPVFTLVAVLTLTLGIGVNSAIFSLVYQILLRPLPYADADRLVFIWNSYPLMGLADASVSIPDYLDRKTQAPAIEDATLFTMRSLNLAEGGQAEQVRGLAVTPSFFSTLGRQPSLGRGFSEAEATPGKDTQVILTHNLWQLRFGGDPSITGRDIRINGEAYKVVGVLPRDFELPGREIGALVPFAFTPEQMSNSNRGNESSQMIARLRPGVSVADADTQMKTIVARVMERLPSRADFARTSGFTGFARPIRQQLVGDTRQPLLVLQGGVLLFLLIACFNVANLLLMRATGRGRELAIRTTLGAGQWRLVRQMLTEGVVLSLVGAVAGLVVGIAGVRALITMSATQVPGQLSASLNLPVVAFTLVLAVITGLVFGAVPAISVIRGNTASLLKEDATRGSATRATGLLRASLLVGEVAGTLVLLVGAGLLIKSFANLQRVDPGFKGDNVLTAQVVLPTARYPNPPERRAFWLSLIAKAQQIPGVVTVGLTSNVPFNGNVGSGSYSIIGYTPGPGDPRPHARQEVVGAEYFKAMQIPLIEGRVFNDGDTAESPMVAVVDRYLAEKYFKGKTAIGQEIQRGGPDNPRIRIVGVVGTINSMDLGQPVTKERIYRPVTQAPNFGMALVVKASMEPTQLVSAVRRAVSEINPEQPIFDVRTMEQWMSRSLEGRRTPMALLAIFAAVALVLAGIGIYGVLAYGVTQRVREFGIRQALGADQRSILSLVLSQGMLRTLIGVVIGLAASFMFTRVLQTLLFGVDAHDLSVFAGVSVLLLAVAALACYIPARRATQIDPMVALRDS
ncbi:ABC transporter permease [soil metagenome]